MRTDIVVQNVASFRIDPAVLARPDRDLVLIASPLNAARLQARGRCDVFQSVLVLDEFTLDTVTEAVETARSGADDRHDVALLCHDEYSLRLVADVREKLDIAGDRPEQLECFVDKVAMKQALAGAGVRLPRHLRWDPGAYQEAPVRHVADVIAAVGLPAFVKPTNESGSVGALRVDTAEELHAWAARTTSSDWEVDEFIAGTLYHLDTVWQDGVALHVGVNLDVHPCYDYVAGRINGSFTVTPDYPVCSELLEFNARVLEALVDKPSRCVFHHEVFRTSDGDLVFLEIAARAPAALIPHTSQIRYGMNVEEAHFRLQRGEVLTSPAATGPHAAYVYFPKPSGRIVERHRAALASDHRWTWNVQTGDDVSAATDIRDFAASVLLWHSDPAVLQHDLAVLDRHGAVTVA